MHLRPAFATAADPGKLLAIPLVLCFATSLLPAQVTQHYKETPLVSNLASMAPITDGNLVNPWGLSRSSGSPWWVSDNGSGLSTLYTGTGGIVPLVVTIPSGDPHVSTTGTPTGTVFNGDPKSFLLPSGTAAAFLFSTEDGTISGWAGGTAATIVVNTKSKSVYKGLTVATATIDGKTGTYLYAADFRRGTVAVFDAGFHPVRLESGDSGWDDRHDADRDGRHDGDRDDHGGAFEDQRLPSGYAPFNVQNIGGNIYVAFAQQDSERHDEVDGPGKGYVDIFSPTGRLLRRLQHVSALNAPWGLALGSSDFGAYSHTLLVGQFGSGEILAFDAVTGAFKGALQDASNKPIVIDGLWAIAFGNGTTAGPANSLFFTAGLDHEQNGLLGTITAIENVQGNDQ